MKHTDQQPWDDIFDLMNWFNAQISYREQLHENEKKQIKDRIRKYGSKEIAGLLLYDLQYFISQNYFEEVDIKEKITVKYNDSIVHQIMPVSSIEFNKNFIEIGEIEGRNLKYKKYTKSNSVFSLESERETQIKKDMIPYELIFPSGKKILLKHLKL